MKNYKVVKGDLFSAEPGTLLVHACNCKGVWGSGIAVEFKNRYPDAFKFYNSMCGMFGDELLGKAEIHHSTLVVCFYTSRGYGNSVDGTDLILSSTQSALDDFFNQLGRVDKFNVASPKFNSGLFKVPWEHTEQLLKGKLMQYENVNWTVYEL